MIRKLIICSIVLCAAISQVQAKSVAVILSLNNDSVQALKDGFCATLSEKGFREQPVVYSLKEQDAATVASKVQAQKPDLVLTVGGEASGLLKSELAAIPGVYTLVSNNPEHDTVNDTGVSVDIPPALRVERIKAILPSVRRVGVLYSPANQSSFDDIAAACSAAGLKAVGRIVASEADFLPAVQALMGGQADCVMMILDTRVYFGQAVRTLLLESQKNKVPVIGLALAFTKGGAVVSVDCDYRDIGRQAGELAARILNGEKPGAVRSQRPRKAQYSLNTQIAAQLGVQLSGSAVSEATDVVR
jgi:putative ABC transport system substrate-binding protein